MAGGAEHCTTSTAMMTQPPRRAAAAPLLARHCPRSLQAAIGHSRIDDQTQVDPRYDRAQSVLDDRFVVSRERRRNDSHAGMIVIAPCADREITGLVHAQYPRCSVEPCADACVRTYQSDEYSGSGVR